MNLAARHIAWFASAMGLWMAMVTHTWPGLALVFVIGISACAYATGDLIARVVESDLTGHWGAAPRLALGLPVLGAGQYVLSMVLPWSNTVVWWAVVGVIMLTWLSTFRGESKRPVETDGVVSRWFLPLVLLIVTLWCRDLLRPIELQPEVAVLRAWSDVYYHLSQIAALGAAHGPGTLSDVQMAGAAAHPYHFASYALPALLNRGAGQTVWAAYAGLLVPLGLTLSALAAYTLTRPHFGEFAAAAAALGLLLLPDAAQLGTGVRFLGYHWLQQVGPAGLYGVACAALALFWLNQACLRGRWIWLPIAYAYLLCALTFKAQIFMAASFPVLIWPALFMRGLTRPARLSGLALLTVGYGGVMLISQHIPGVPVVKLDGSGLWPYSQKILAMQSGGLIKKATLASYVWAGENGWLRATAFGAVLFWSTLSIYGLVGIRTFRSQALRQQGSPLWSWTPWLIVACYLTMSLGLAMDNRQIGMPEELLHRPFVWAYFVWVVWLLAALYWLRFGNALPPQGKPRLGLMAFAMLALLVTPGHFGHGIQTMKSWDRGYQMPARCMVDVAWYLRDHSRSDEAFQDLGKDPEFAFSGLSERRAHAVDSGGVRMPPGLSDRMKALEALRTQTDAQSAADGYRRAGIRHVISRPGFRAAWEGTLAAPPALTCGDYRVYAF
jgi:hypothetical protein